MSGYYWSRPMDYSLTLKNVPHIFPVVNSSYFDVERTKYQLLFDGYYILIPPPLELYTQFSLQEHFLIFWAILFIQILTISIVDKIYINNIPSSVSLWQRFVHSCQKINFPFPYTNWHEGNGSDSDYQHRKNAVEKEVLVATTVNLVFSMILLIPLVILCKSILEKMSQAIEMNYSYDFQITTFWKGIINWKPQLAFLTWK